MDLANKKNSILFLLLFSSFSIYPQENQIFFNHLNIEKGLSNSSVLSIIQDSYGFMWFGTQDGLNRYDGYTFKVYRNDPLDNNSVSDLGIRKLFVDYQGDLWVVNLNGKLDKYDPFRDTFIHYDLIESSSSNSDLAVAITHDINGTLWIGCSNGNLYYYDLKSNLFIYEKINVKDKRNLSSRHLHIIHADKYGKLWIGTWQGLYSYDIKSKSLNLVDNTSSDMIFDIKEDSLGRIWFASANGGIKFFDRNTKTFIRYQNNSLDKNSLGSDRVMSILPDAQSNIWIGTVEKGLDLLKSGTTSFIHYTYSPSVPWSISNGAVSSIYEDRSGGMWIGTYPGGINYFQPEKQFFKFIGPNTADDGSISSSAVLSLCEDKEGTLWVGTDGGGLSQKLKGQSKFRHFFRNQVGYTSNSITALCLDLYGNLWIGSDPGAKYNHGVLLKYEVKTNKFIEYENIQLNLGGITCLYGDSKGELWIGTALEGLRKYNIKTGSTSVFRHNEKNASSISGNFVTSILEDRLGNIWVGTVYSGLNMFDANSNEFIVFRNEPKNKNSLSSNRILCITEDTFGNIWVGTWGNGLNLLNPNTGKCVQISVKDGLPGNTIYSMIPDKSGNLWLSTNKGICRFHIKNFSCKNFNKSDGLQCLEYSMGSFCSGKDGQFYFGGINGITAFYPDSIRESVSTPNIVLTSFTVFDSVWYSGIPVNSIKEVSLSYNQNFFSFEFALLDFTASEKNQYTYMLEGVDKNWIRSENRRYASYTDIQPGKYVFRVRGSNSEGIWSIKDARITILINPPFWMSWWFILIIFLCMGGILIIIHQYRINKLLAVERTRVRIARDLHDEVSASITGIRYFAEAILKDKENKNISLNQKLVALINESAADVQEQMSDIIWSINPENDKWDIIFPKFRRYASDLLESKNIFYDIQMPESDYPSKTLSMVKRRNLWLIFKEIITNSVKHSYCSKIRIKIGIEKDYLTLLIEDDGKGFNKDTIQAGNGLKNIRMRSILLKGEAYLKTSPDEGTLWQIRFHL